MTFLESLQAHKGGLIQLKSQLYWHDGRGYDGNPGRVCLILDAALTIAKAVAVTLALAPAAAVAPASAVAAAYLLIDGQPAWIWVAEQDIELLVNDQPIS